jgi:hypothetical protein
MHLPGLLGLESCTLKAYFSVVLFTDMKMHKLRLKKEEENNLSRRSFKTELAIRNLKDI